MADPVPAELGLPGDPPAPGAGPAAAAAASGPVGDPPSDVDAGASVGVAGGGGGAAVGSRVGTAATSVVGGEVKHVTIAAAPAASIPVAPRDVAPGAPGWADRADAGADSDDESVAGVLDPSHPLLERMQRTLGAQLGAHDQRVSLALRQTEEKVNQAKRKREQLGVELYARQKQYAKVQLQLEQTHDSFGAEVKRRSAAEDELKRVQQVQVEARERRVVAEKKRAEVQAELDKIKVTMQEVRTMAQAAV
jgi:hypothetical protein